MPYSNTMKTIKTTLLKKSLRLATLVSSMCIFLKQCSARGIFISYLYFLFLLRQFTVLSLSYALNKRTIPLCRVVNGREQRYFARTFSLWCSLTLLFYVIPDEVRVKVLLSTLIPEFEYKKRDLTDI